MSKYKKVWACEECRSLGVVVSKNDDAIYDEIIRQHQISLPNCNGVARVVFLSNIEETKILLQPIARLEEK